MGVSHQRAPSLSEGEDWYDIIRAFMPLAYHAIGLSRLYCGLGTPDRVPEGINPESSGLPPYSSSYAIATVLPTFISSLFCNTKTHSCFYAISTMSSKTPIFLLGSTGRQSPLIYF